MRPVALVVLVLTACKADPAEKVAGDTGGADALPLRTLTELSSGACPDLSAPGTSSFLSSGVERTATVVFPEDRPANMPVVFFFHGLMSPDYTPDPTQYMADALDLQTLAEETGSIIVLPQSRVMSMYSYTFFMWEVSDADEEDLVLFDDLRTCIADELDPDLTRLAAVGFSGGSLFTTVVARERGDALASMVEMSGGSDIETSFFDAPLAAYGTPAWPMPALLYTGGESDVWPDPSLVVVDFTAATDNLQQELVADGHYAVRCTHDRGHTIVNPEFDAAKAWALAHTFGEPSRYEEAGIADLPESCFIVEPATDGG